MNEKYKETIEKIRKMSVPSGVLLYCKGGLMMVGADQLTTMDYCVVAIFTKYSHSPDTYLINSLMSDDEMEDMFDDIQKRVMVYKNIM